MKIKKYHFLLTKKIFTDLNKISELKNYSYSGKINYIIGLVNSIILFLDPLNIDENSNVEYLSDKRDIQLYINNKLYKKIKYYHANYNTYSMALFIRMILRIFIKMVNKYGFILALRKIKKQNKKLLKIRNRYKRLSMIQLLYFLNIKYEKNLRIEFILVQLLL